MVYLGLISLGGRKTRAGEGLECSIWWIFWFWEYDGRSDGCTEDRGCAGVEGRWSEYMLAMWGVLGVLVVR